MTIDEEHSHEIIRRGLELGVNFFDTAIGYQSVRRIPQRKIMCGLPEIRKFEI